jgi:hypothetical protein
MNSIKIVNQVRTDDGLEVHLLITGDIPDEADLAFLRDAIGRHQVSNLNVDEPQPTFELKAFFEDRGALQRVFNPYVLSGDSRWVFRSRYYPEDEVIKFYSFLTDSDPKTVARLREQEVKLSTALDHPVRPSSLIHHLGWLLTRAARVGYIQTPADIVNLSHAQVLCLLEDPNMELKQTEQLLVLLILKSAPGTTMRMPLSQEAEWLITAPIAQIFSMNSRIHTALKRDGVKFLGQLLFRHPVELAMIHNLGEKFRPEVIQAVKQFMQEKFPSLELSWFPIFWAAE